MRLLDIVNGMWAMAGGRVQELRELYFAHTRREKLDLKAWEAATGRPAGAERQPYQLVDGVAVISIQGIITKVDSMWNRLCGMTSSVLTQQDLRAALEDRQAHSILLWIDSPGGMVDGTQELADAVFAARQQKPIVALGDGCMCSAAYWVGSAAEKVYITSDTTEVGSVGVVTAHTDVSQQEAMQGVKTTELVSGDYKRIASQYAPLSEEGRAYIKAHLDHIYTVFVDSIAKFRGVSVDTVLAQMANGRVFLGKQAVEAGLVDGVSSMTNLIAQLNQDRNAWKPTTGAGALSDSSATSSQENTMPITREQLAAEAPNLLNALQAEGKAEGAASGASAELARVKGCLDASILGYEDLALSFALDGKTTPGEAALAVLAKQKADLSAAHANATDASKGAAVLPPSGDAAAAEAEAARVQAEADAKAKGQGDLKARWESNANLRNLYGTYEAFVEANEAAATAAANGRILQKGR